MASSSKNRISWHKTLLANLLYLPWKEAIQFPIYVYKNTLIVRSHGKIVFDCPMRKGILHIGYTISQKSLIKEKTFFNLQGKLIIKGDTKISFGSHFVVEHNATAELGKNVLLATSSRFHAFQSICIGNDFSFGFNSVICDSDYHFIVNVESGEIKNRTRPIKLGDRNWIGAYCSVNKGTITPDDLILAGPYSLLHKDYTKSMPTYPLLAGCPAKLISHGYRRIYHIDSERALIRIMREQSLSYTIPDVADLDKLCIDGSFFNQQKH